MTQKNTDIILSTSKILMNAGSAQEIVENLSKAYQDYFGITRIDFLTLDYTTGMFQDFVRDWLYVEDENCQKIVFAVFNTLKKQLDKFILNGRVFSYNPDEKELSEIKEVGTNEINLIYFPLFSQDRVFGVIEVQYEKINENLEINEELFNTLQVLLYQISTAVNNSVIIGHMADGLNFYDVMKNIAKIIESQYELEYIVPQIGEMIDRFISSHLIYIFLKDKEKEGEYKLLWPTSCNNEEIIEMLNKEQNQEGTIISEDRRIGVFPLQGEKEILGAMVAYSTIGKLSLNTIEYMEELTKQSSITLQRANVYSEVLKHATMDALTGLNNRRQFEIRLNQETSKSARKGTDLCCLMLDIDYFKRVNDTYGHAAGDCVLKGVAKIISNTVREYDIACRYGGEEFFIILPMTTLEETAAVAERLKTNIQNAQIDIKEAKVKGIPFLQVTASIGVNSYDKKCTPEEFYQGADKALYKSKLNGRNRVTIYGSEEMQEEVQ
ncbi:MAG: GGDEF domain-containing protein [Candidatus Gastranaerophilaceae bacterium]